MKRLFLLALLLVSAVASRAAETVSVAAAANLVFALDALNAEFKRVAPDVTLTSTSGASGNLTAQIKNGAPFDVFLSADTDYPKQLVEAKLGDASSLKVFATGRLVLWTTNPEIKVDDIAAAVRSPAANKIAIAQPRTAPYGRVAQAVLEKLGVWDVAQPKIVFGDNITQTAQFVETGNAPIGFVALSLVKSPKLTNQGKWFEIPASMHPGESLDHAGVLTNRGAANPAAKRYLDFLATEPAKKILRDFGYGVP